MSDAEKAAQVGEAMLLLENQKRELAHLTAKIEKVKQAYRVFGSQRERWCVDSIDRNKVFLTHPTSDERDLASFLLAEPALAALIGEYQMAENALNGTKAKLASFGINTS